MLFDHQVKQLLAKCLAASLYHTEPLEFEAGLMAVASLRAYSGKFETYCPQCRKDSIFKLDGGDTVAWVAEDKKRLESLKTLVTKDKGPFQRQTEERWLGPFVIAMTCTRMEDHVVRIYLNYLRHGKFIQPVAGEEFGHFDYKRELVKVGQWPSVVDFQQHELDEFKDAFETGTLREWKRALITQAHGFHVAACVHLRRVFEGLLSEARDQVEGGRHKGAPWPEFDDARMAERVRLVKTELPAFISEHPELYRLLSLGVHQLSEDECARELPMLQNCMRLIAAQRLEDRKKRKHEEQVKSLLREASNRLIPSRPQTS